MTIDRNKKAARTQVMAVIIVASVIAIREAYLSGSGGNYVIALVLIILLSIVFALPDKNSRGKFPSGKIRER